MTGPESESFRQALQVLYNRYATRERAAHDPVSRISPYGCQPDREVAGLVAAMLAYGRLKQILASVDDALGRLGQRPARFLLQADDAVLSETCSGFVHRFAKAEDLCGLLRGARDALRRWGTLQACFREADPGGRTLLPALERFARRMAGGGHTHLVADPSRGSACKRWHLFLRWMVRSDAVDPGCWSAISPARLLVPLDAHMWRICRGLGLTSYASPTRKAALQVTEGFGAICPEDPVRYDFALMHASVNEDPDLMRLLQPGTT
jgi:uncharacterized protein (TIGR02757 family)